MNYKISIITINYNNLEGLKRTVESVVNQTWKQFEYIIIDGGSTDGSADYIESQNENIDYWVSEPDKGIYNAMNKGIVKATGEYLLFLNSGDDLKDTNVLGENYIHLEEKDLICFDINVIDENVFFVKKCPEELTFSFLYQNTLPHQSTFIRKSLFKRVGYYDENLKIASDWKFFILAMMRHEATYKQVDVVLSNYYLGGISSCVDYSNERDEVLKKYFSGYILDYIEFFENRKELVDARIFLKSNRVKMLAEIERKFVGRKVLSFFLRTYIILFSKKRLNDLLN